MVSTTFLRHTLESDFRVGQLLPHILEEFRSTSVHSLSLTETLRNDAKTDLPATETLIGSFPTPFFLNM